MIKPIIVALILCSALAAPSADKMTKLPVSFFLNVRGTPIVSSQSHLFTVATSLSVQESERLIMSLLNLPKDLVITTLSPSGSTEVQAAHHFSVRLLITTGFLQEIGPYYLEDGANYKVGDSLTLNQYSWHNLTNLLFLESPAGVGYSYNLNTTFEYNDVQTAQDNFIALVEFYKKFPEYSSRGLWIAGESYAGKYIPDLAALIMQNNEAKNSSIKLKGILIGNGIISFEHLERSEIEFMVARNFVDPETIQYWKSSCQTDPDSAGCQFFLKRYREDVRELNPYSIYFP